jgi:hypothetical protein
VEKLFSSFAVRGGTAFGESRAPAAGMGAAGGGCCGGG